MPAIQHHPLNNLQDIEILAGKGEDRHAISRHVSIYAFMRLLVLDAF